MQGSISDLKEQISHARKQLLKIFATSHKQKIDEVRNFDMLLPELLKVVETHLTIHQVDTEADELHHIYVKDCFFVKPVSSGVGSDTPRSALLHGRYVAMVVGNLIHDIRTRGTSENYSENSPTNFSFNEYSVTKSTTHAKSIPLLEIPVLIGSKLCNTQSRHFGLESINDAYIQNATFCVSRHFKQFPYDETIRNNTPLSFKPNELQIRSRFVIPRKKYRTNATIKLSLTSNRYRKLDNWVNRFHIMLRLPHEHPHKLVPVSTIAIAFGCNKSVFYDLVLSTILQRCNECQRNEMKRIVSPIIQCLLTSDPHVNTTNDACRAISKHISKTSGGCSDRDACSYVRFLLCNEIFPHLNQFERLGDDYSHQSKQSVLLLARSTARLIVNSQELQAHIPKGVQRRLMDRNSLEYIRLNSIGECFLVLTRFIIRSWTKTIRMKLKYQICKGVNLRELFSEPNNKLTNAVRSGEWDVYQGKNNESKLHKTQMLITGYCSDGLLNTQIVKNSMRKSTSVDAFLPHPTGYGRIDPALTPESERCGTVKYKTMGCIISEPHDIAEVEKDLIRVLQACPTNAEYTALLPTTEISSVISIQNTPDIHTMIGCSGEVLGWTRRPWEVIKHVREMRRLGVLPHTMSISINNDYSLLECSIDNGRLLRPLVVKKHVQRLLKYMQSVEYHFERRPMKALVRMGFIMIIDAAEEFNTDIVVSFDWQDPDSRVTHLEIDGALGHAITMNNAFNSFDSGPRRVYSANMRKRTLSMKPTHDLGCVISHSLWHAQRPLISTVVDQVLSLRSTEPNGINVNLAILCLPDNMEDAWVMKKEAFERGMGISSEAYTLNVVRGSDNIIKRPDNGCFGVASGYRYRALASNGLPIIGSVIPGGGAVVGQVCIDKSRGSVEHRCVSTFLPNQNIYVVDSVEIFPHDADHENISVVRVRMRRTHYPEMGDKFFLGHGQKGTCGRIISQIDMPFYARDGTSPDVIINVCSLMRVTMGLMMEMLFGKARCMTSDTIGAYNSNFWTPSEIQHNMRRMEDVLSEFGLLRGGKDVVFCGKTGQKLKCSVFNGVGYLRILNHFSNKKVRARERGPVCDLTRQTTVGKQNNGGQKIGEMMNWNFYSYGISETARSMNYESADAFDTYWCDKCQWFAVGNDRTNRYYCPSCIQDSQTTPPEMMEKRPKKIKIS